MSNNTFENGEKNQWFTNKELYLLIQQNTKEYAESMKEMSKEFTESIKQVNVKIDELSDELTITRREMKEYNNLRSALNQNIKDVVEVKTDVGKIQQELADQQAKKEGIKAVGDFIIKWGGWIILVATFLGKVFNWF